MEYNGTQIIKTALKKNSNLTEGMNRIMKANDADLIIVIGNEQGRTMYLGTLLNSSCEKNRCVMFTDGDPTSQKFARKLLGRNLLTESTEGFQNVGIYCTDWAYTYDDVKDFGLGPDIFFLDCRNEESIRDAAEAALLLQEEGLVIMSCDKKALSQVDIKAEGTLILEVCEKEPEVKVRNYRGNTLGKIKLELKGNEAIKYYEEAD